MQSDINGLFGNTEQRPTGMALYPPINLWVGDDSAVVTAELPGVDEKDLEILVQRDTLTIQGSRGPEGDDEGIDWHRRERALGRFSRTVELPFRVDADDVQARFFNGVLEVELKRPEEDRPRRIEITAN